MTPADIFAPTRRSRQAVRARHVAIYLAHVKFGVPLSGVAAVFGRDRATVAYACHTIEDSRDNPAFDAVLTGLELAASVLLERQARESVA